MTADAKQATNPTHLVQQMIHQDYGNTVKVTPEESHQLHRIEQADSLPPDYPEEKQGTNVLQHTIIKRPRDSFKLSKTNAMEGAVQAAPGLLINKPNFLHAQKKHKKITNNIYMSRRRPRPYLTQTTKTLSSVWQPKTHTTPTILRQAASFTTSHNNYGCPNANVLLTTKAVA
ncbi:hypothetical protein CHS0354_017727 [Potamilus streckersoni]|uniref:Uncharacterized protein n=1 Tax=Potamilus streckersoni TaxID=2493646 RepID=A0AAE0SIJ7_9BIVA|nr:hypothetical protein CHS0354_017727 [Potamilus streckersoni]